jgi:hypothetical protein
LQLLAVQLNQFHDMWKAIANAVALFEVRLVTIAAALHFIAK